MVFFAVLIGVMSLNDLAPPMLSLTQATSRTVPCCARGSGRSAFLRLECRILRRTVHARSCDRPSPCIAVILPVPRTGVSPASDKGLVPASPCSLGRQVWVWLFVRSQQTDPTPAQGRARGPERLMPHFIVHFLLTCQSQGIQRAVAVWWPFRILDFPDVDVTIFGPNLLNGFKPIQ